MEENRDLGDLALQFDGSEAGLQFIATWKQAGIASTPLQYPPPRHPIAALN